MSLFQDFDGVTHSYSVGAIANSQTVGLQNGWTTNYYGTGEPSPHVDASGYLHFPAGNDYGAVIKAANIVDQGTLPALWTNSYEIELDFKWTTIDPNPARGWVALNLISVGSIGDGNAHRTGRIALKWSGTDLDSNIITQILFTPLNSLGQTSSAITFDKTAWTHVKIVYDGTYCWIAIDGRIVAEFASYPNKMEFSNGSATPGDATNVETGAFSLHAETQDSTGVCRVKNLVIRSPIDTTAPTVSSWATNVAGTEITGTISESSCLPASSLGQYFTLSGTSATVTGGSSGSISGTTITLPLTGAVAGTDTVTISSASPADYDTHVVTTLSAVLYWILDESSGITADDETANGYDGTYLPNGSGTWTGGGYKGWPGSMLGKYRDPSPWMLGKTDLPKLFVSGSSNRVEGSAANVLTLTAWTMCALIWPSAPPASGAFAAIVGVSNSSVRRTILWYEADAAGCYLCARVYNSADTLTTVRTTATATCTFAPGDVSAANNTISITNNGLPVNAPVYFSTSPGGTLPGGLSASTVYYVVTAGTAFKVSTTLGGSEVDITSGGVGSHHVHCTSAGPVQHVVVTYDDSVDRKQRLYINGTECQYQRSCTAATNDTITCNAHGLSNDSVVYFRTTGTLPAPLAVGTGYYVIDSATNTFKVSATQGGSAVDITDTGSGTHYVYPTPAGPANSGTLKDSTGMYVVVGAGRQGGVSGQYYDGCIQRVAIIGSALSSSAITTWYGKFTGRQSVFNDGAPQWSWWNTGKGQPFANISGANVENNVPSDTDPPTATLTSAPDIAASAAYQTIVVTFTDETAVDVSTIDSNTINVTGPSSFDDMADLDDKPANDTSPAECTFLLNAPEGGFPAGTYSVYVVGNGHPTDTLNNTILVPEKIGEFNVATASLCLPSGLIAMKRALRRR